MTSVFLSLQGPARGLPGTPPGDQWPSVTTPLPQHLQHLTLGPSRGRSAVSSSVAHLFRSPDRSRHRIITPGEQGWRVVGLPGAHSAHSEIVVRDDKIAPMNCLSRWERAVAAVLRRLVFLALVGMAQFLEAQQRRTFQFVLLQFHELMHTLGGPSGGRPRSTGAMRGHCLSL